MSVDNLLLWMSARGSGTWPQFRGAIEQLHIEDANLNAPVRITSDLPMAWRLRLDCQRLGHVEFERTAHGTRWRVTPPSLGITQHADKWMGVLVGARSPKLLARLDTYADPELIDRISTQRYPQHIRLFAPDILVLRRLALQVGLYTQLHAPMALLTSLPYIRHAAYATEVELPIGKEWLIHRFVPRDLTWTNATRDDAQGASMALFRFTLRHEHHSLLCANGRIFRTVPSVGKYVVLSHNRRRVVEYDANAKSMIFPMSCRPPFLLERALILCSGLMPAHERSAVGSGVLRYADVPSEIASLAAELLGQGLR